MGRARLGVRNGAQSRHHFLQNISFIVALGVAVPVTQSRHLWHYNHCNAGERHGTRPGMALGGRGTEAASRTRRVVVAAAVASFAGVTFVFGLWLALPLRKRPLLSST